MSFKEKKNRILIGQRFCLFIMIHGRGYRCIFDSPNMKCSSVVFLVGNYQPITFSTPISRCTLELGRDGESVVCLVEDKLARRPS